MTTEQIAEQLQNHTPGVIFGMVVRRDCAIRKGLPHRVEKISRFQGMLADYASRKPVKDGVENGLREAPELPSYVKSTEKINGIKFWVGNNGQFYYPLPITGNPPKVQYLLDGNPVSFADVEQYLLASEKRPFVTKEEAESKMQAQFVCIKVENVQEVVIKAKADQKQSPVLPPNWDLV